MSPTQRDAKKNRPKPDSTPVSQHTSASHMIATRPSMTWGFLKTS